MPTQFCSGSLFNLSELWFTNPPQMSTCFEKTALLFVSGLFTLTFSMLWIMHALFGYFQSPLTGKRFHSCKRMPYLIIRIMTNVLWILCCTALWKLDPHPQEVATPLSWCLLLFCAFMDAMLLFGNFLHHWNSIYVTAAQFIFHLLFCIFYIPSLYQHLADHDSAQNINVILDGILLFLTVLSALLSVALSPLKTLHRAPHDCPEPYAELTSKVFFTWLNSLISRAYHNSLQDEDVFQLRQSEQIKFNMNQFAQANAITHCPTTVKNSSSHVKETTRLLNSAYSVNPTSSSTTYLTSSPEESSEVSFAPSPSSKKPVSILRTLTRVFGGSMLLATLLGIVSSLMEFLNPFLLNLMILQVSSGSSSNSADASLWKGVFLAVLFFLVGLVGSVLSEVDMFFTDNIALRIQSTLSGAIYRKALLLSSAAKQTTSTGEIVNLMSVDAERISEFIPMSVTLITSPLQISVCIWLLWQQLGLATLPGLVVLLICIPVNAVLMWYMTTMDTKQMDWKDKRLKLLYDVLNGIRVLKFYTWETSFEKRLKQLRQQELRCLRKIYFTWAPISIMMIIAPFFVTCLSLLTFVYTGGGTHLLTPSRAFVSMALFGMIQMPMIMLPYILSLTVNAVVSYRRVQTFLLAEELDLTGYDIQQEAGQQPDTSAVVAVTNGTFTWTKKAFTEDGQSLPEPTPVLRNIQLSVPPGSFVAIVGKIGSGKSSLLSALLGEMHRLSGSISIHGRVAYVPQTSWIQHLTVKENILFGSEMDPAWYDTVLDKCCLRSDLKLLMHGDETMIGDRGINLSGGQKQRVSLARAVYQRADIYLLDDPLSAVDAHVGKELFEGILSNTGLLANKTRILVTHGLQWLPMVDEVIVLDTLTNGGGHIAERGSYHQLMTDASAFADFVQQNAFESGAEESQSQKKTSESSKIVTIRQISQKGLRQIASPSRTLSSSSGENEEEKGNNFEEEGGGDDDNNEEELVAEGRVSFKVYGDYIRARGYLLSLVAILFYALFCGTELLGSIWIQRFTEDPTILNATEFVKMPPDVYKDVLTVTNYYMLAYGLTGVGQALEALVFTVCHSVASIAASRVLHNELLARILRAPLHFFDTTPNGRILNRFSKDMESIDLSIPDHFNDCLHTFFAVLVAIAAIVYSTPWFLLAFLPLAVIYFVLQMYYFPIARQSRRLCSVTRSPIFTHFTESLQGISVIRASQQMPRFIHLNDQCVDRNARFVFLRNSCVAWLTVRLDIIGSAVVFLAVLFVAFDRAVISPALAGLSISFALTVTQNLRWMVMQSADLETDAVSIERVVEYTHVEQEMDTFQSQVTAQPDSSWPQEGLVEFHHYSARYRPNLPLALQHLNVTIKAGEKVGVVGRTGAGKSSLTLALFRLLETAHGRICIDGVDIESISLHQLRSRITILPQDPVLFQGTLRDNLDPFNEQTDEQLWSVLESAHLKEWVSSLADGLNHDCAEGGQNVSVGQRQLICLARALLKKTKLLILDEATAAVDRDTDRLLMQTIFQEFQHSTIIIIAHRLNTILSANRVIVMKEGDIEEVGSPEELMNNPNTVFHSMALESGLLKA